MKGIKINKLFIVLTFLSLLFALLQGGLLPYLLFYSLFFLFIISFFYIYIISKTLYVKVDAEQSYFSAGDNTECTTEINCTMTIPIPYVEVKNSDSDEVVTLTMNENTWINKKINFHSRGIYDVGTVYLKAFDVLNIVSFYKKEDLSTKLKVYPKVYQINSLSGGGKDVFINTFDKTVSNEDQFTIKDVRKYRNGDSLKKVHWKLSAKHNELYVKNADTISGEELILFMDMNKNNYSYDMLGKAEEAVVDISMSIIHYMIQRDMNLNIFINSDSLTSYKVYVKEDFNSLMELMVNMKSNGSLDLSTFMKEQCYKLPKVNKLVIVTAALNETLSNNLISYKKQGYNLSVFFYLKDTEAESHKNILKSWGIDCIDFDSVYKISEVSS
jgi:uncharacterized protein (DUF58 family)